MFGSTSRSANAYGKVGLETGVSTASPHKLIVMLFDGALTALALGHRAMQSGDIAVKGKSITQAMAIIDNGLRAALDKNAGGDIANNLDALYIYMSDRLLMANLNNKPELIEEVQHLLRELKSAWEAIGTGAPPVRQAPETVFAAAPLDPLAPRVQRVIKA